MLSPQLTTCEKTGKTIDNSKPTSPSAGPPLLDVEWDVLVPGIIAAFDANNNYHAPMRFWGTGHQGRQIIVNNVGFSVTTSRQPHPETGVRETGYLLTVSHNPHGDPSTRRQENFFIPQAAVRKMRVQVEGWKLAKI